MIISVTELLYLFFVYAFAGWVLETIFGSIRNRKLVNRGWVNGPFCVVYGIAAVAITVGFADLDGFALFASSAILATVIEWVAGHLVERVYQERWWDYSEVKWNLDGYICLPMSVVWGALGFGIVKWCNAGILWIYKWVPEFVMVLILWILLAILTIDILASVWAMSGKYKTPTKLEEADEVFTKVSARLTRWIKKRVVNRVKNAYPRLKNRPKEEAHPEIFAYGCSFYKIFLLFMIGAFLGDLTEMVFCRITAGYWMSRSSVVFGPFSVVWGLGIAMFTMLLYRYKDASDRFLFFAGTLLGGTYEYLCSVFTEICFGQIFWDYSWMPLNLGGRINLLYCFFWGIAAIVWFKVFYKPLSKWIEKIPKLTGTIVSWCLVLFMVVNVIVSGLALLRYDQRGRDVPATMKWQQTIDEHYPDEKMEQIYPNSKMVKDL